MSFQFGNVVVVDGGQVGVIVKSWADGTHEVYVRNLCGLKLCKAEDIRHFIYSKDLTVEEREFY